MSDHWTHYWQTSRALSSFKEGSSAMGYQGEFADNWLNHAKLLPSNASVLDIGCGNGALACTIRQFSNANGLNFTIFATDLAKITPLQSFSQHPQVLDQLQTIQFFPSTANEKLPFDDETFDLVTSCFAIEYGNQRESFSEAIRVTKSHGTFVACVHHHQSEITVDSESGLDVLKYAIFEQHLLSRVESLLAACQTHLKAGDIHTWFKSAQCAQSSNEIKHVMQHLLQRYPNQPHATWAREIVSKSAQILQALGGNTVGDCLVALKDLNNGVKRQIERLEEQVSVAYTPEKLAELKQHANYLGAELAVEESKLQGHKLPIAYKIVMTK